MSDSSKNLGWNIIFSAWLIALIASLGSLFFSEVMLFPPCVFCWYQRICMYPLVFIFLAGLFPLDRNVVKYSLPLAGIGWLISIYHNLLSFGIIPESAAPCVQGVSCATVYIKWLGFITIPILSFTAFSMIIALLIFLKRKIPNE